MLGITFSYNDILEVTNNYTAELETQMKTLETEITTLSAKTASLKVNSS